MQPTILFRSDLDSENEAAVASQYLPTVASRTRVPQNSLVVGRYSVLPFYQELERDLAVYGARLVNTYAEHAYIADVMAWGGPAGVLGERGMTPRTWSDWYDLPLHISYVVKGRTNSRKFEWATRMFCATRADVPAVANSLLDDTFIREQGLVVREFVPLMRLGVGINNLPISNEWRTFWFSDANGTHLLCRGFYWRGTHPELEEAARWTEEAEDLTQRAAQLVGQHATFFVLDVAQKANGGWTVIEVNDGQMSGLSGCDPHALYSALHARLG